MLPFPARKSTITPLETLTRHLWICGRDIYRGFEALDRHVRFDSGRWRIGVAIARRLNDTYEAPPPDSRHQRTCRVRATGRANPKHGKRRCGSNTLGDCPELSPVIAVIAGGQPFYGRQAGDTFVLRRPARMEADRIRSCGPKRIVSLEGYSSGHPKRFFGLNRIVHVGLSIS